MPFPRIWWGSLILGDFDAERDSSLSFLNEVKLNLVLKNPENWLKYDKSLGLATKRWLPSVVWLNWFGILFLLVSLLLEFEFFVSAFLEVFFFIVFSSSFKPCISSYMLLFSSSINCKLLKYN